MTLSQKEQNAESRVDAIATSPEQDHTNIAGPENNNPLVFPASSLIGSIGELAIALSEGTEVPAEFIFVAGLTALGSLCSRDLKFDIGCNVQPRLYTLLLGNSADVKKSTALAKTLDFFKGMAYKMETTPLERKLHVVHGVGSAEGLVRELQDQPNLLLAYDELKGLVDKFQVRGSSLLSVVASLFEGNDWQNVTKKKNQSQVVHNANLSLIGCSTRATYERMWSNDAISIGLPNRLFIVDADRKVKVALPQKPDPKRLEEIRERIISQFPKQKLVLPITGEAQRLWEQWYKSLPASEHAKRLDTIGLRLLPLIAMTTDKKEIDVEAVKAVLAILDYQLAIRIQTDPIDVNNRIAELEEKIRRQLRTRGTLSYRDLFRYTHADRYGIWAFRSALENLQKAQEIKLGAKGYCLI
jgi:hypothetical protein